MATARMAMGTALGTITDTAIAVSSVMTTASDSIGMVHNYVRHARNKQEETQLVDMLSFRDRLIEDTAKEATQRQEEILNYLHGNPERQRLYESAQARLVDAFQKFDQSKQVAKAA